MLITVLKFLNIGCGRLLDSVELISPQKNLFDEKFALRAKWWVLWKISNQRKRLEQKSTSGLLGLGNFHLIWEFCPYKEKTWEEKYIGLFMVLLTSFSLSPVVFSRKIKIWTGIRYKRPTNALHLPNLQRKQILTNWCLTSIIAWSKRIAYIKEAIYMCYYVFTLIAFVCRYIAASLASQNKRGPDDYWNWGLVLREAKRTNAGRLVHDNVIQRN